MSVEERLKQLKEFVKCPETVSAHYGEWGILTKEQRLFLDKMVRDTLDLLDCMDKKIRETNQKIEQGTLIELPCKVGDTVYETDGVSIYETKIMGIVYDGTPIAFSETAIGKYIFLTREEAEKRLKELQNKNIWKY
jgi:hypothetical protein